MYIHCTVLYSMCIHCTVLYSMYIHCTVLYSMYIHCTVLYALYILLNTYSCNVYCAYVYLVREVEATSIVAASESAGRIEPT